MTKHRTEKIDPAQLILPAGFEPDPEKLRTMIQSVREKSLLHPPCIKENFEVFAGEIHVKACQVIGTELVECRVYPSDLEPDEYTEISLNKSLQNPTLTWDEQVGLEKRLHELRQDQNGVGKRGKKDGWSLRDTAAELGMSFGVLSEDIRMADALEADPTLKRIKDKTTARRVIFDTLKRANQQASTSIPATVDINVCHHGGSEVILRAYPDNTFDACITDPPWLEFKDKTLIKDEYTYPVFKEVFRTLKNNSFLYMFVSTQDWHYYSQKLPELGFNVQKYPLIWVKEGVLTHGVRSWEYQRNFEPILLAVKGSPALIDNMLSSVMSTKVVPSGLLRHPNEKPKDIIKILLDHCTYDNALVLDPFSGSFVVADCCRETHRRYVAIENNADYYTKGVERLK